MTDIKTPTRNPPRPLHPASPTPAAPSTEAAADRIEAELEVADKPEVKADLKPEVKAELKSDVRTTLEESYLEVVEGDGDQE